MTELRLILLIGGTLLVLGIYYWGRRGRKREAELPYVRGEEDWLQKLAEQRNEPRADQIPTLDFDIHDDVVARSEPVLGDIELDDEPSEALVVRTRHARAFDAEEPLIEEEEQEALPLPPPRHTEVATDIPLDTAPPPVERSEPAAHATQAHEPGEELILVLHVMAPSGATFPGTKLFTAMNQAGLFHGDMNIFHLHRDRDPSGPVLFSVANILEPGTFDPTTAEDFQTPGLALFMRLPGPMEAEAAFEKMLATGRLLAQLLDGVLKDETRSTLTQQTIGHLRERVAAFQFKQSLARKKK